MHAARPVGLRLIAAFKFVKASILVVAGVGALRLLSPERAAWAQDWLEALSLDLDHRLVGGLAGHAATMLDLATSRQLGRLAAAAFLFAAVYLVQGVGLALARRWAEYLTVALTTSFLPFEIIAAWHRFTLLRSATIVVNVVVVIYLLGELRSSAVPKKTSKRATFRSGDHPMA